MERKRSPQSSCFTQDEFIRHSEHSTDILPADLAGTDISRVCLSAIYRKRLRKPQHSLDQYWITTIVYLLLLQHILIGSLPFLNDMPLSLWTIQSRSRRSKNCGDHVLQSTTSLIAQTVKKLGILVGQSNATSLVTLTNCWERRSLSELPKSLLGKSGIYSKLVITSTNSKIQSQKLRSRSLELRTMYNVYTIRIHIHIPHGHSRQSSLSHRFIAIFSFFSPRPRSFMFSSND